MDRVVGCHFCWGSPTTLSACLVSSSNARDFHVVPQVLGSCICVLRDKAGIWCICPERAEEARVTMSGVDRRKWLSENREGKSLRKQSCLKTTTPGASLVVQWLRICLPRQATWVRAGLGRSHMLQSN